MGFGIVSCFAVSGFILGESGLIVELFRGLVIGDTGFFAAGAIGVDLLLSTIPPIPCEWVVSLPRILIVESRMPRRCIIPRPALSRIIPRMCRPVLSFLMRFIPRRMRAVLSIIVPVVPPALIDPPLPEWAVAIVGS